MQRVSRFLGDHAFMRYSACFFAIEFFISCAFADFREQVESDWLLQEQLRSRNATVTAQSDAAGGCDGIKNGRWGFHTNCVESPWWQVDLGKVAPVDRVVVWNRCDAADRATRIRILFSDDGASWRTVYMHDGTLFYGMQGGPPLSVTLAGEKTQYVRITTPGVNFLHFDEVEVFGPSEPAKNLALNRPANQCGTSPWSANHLPGAPDWPARTRAVLEHARALAHEFALEPDALKRIEKMEASLHSDRSAKNAKRDYLEARWVLRTIALKNPLLDFDTILFVKRVPGRFSHMSDQYYGWWSRPGGGVYLLRDFRSDAPTLTCLSGAFAEPGSFLRPSLSFDGRKVLFAWCKHYPKLAKCNDKLNKDNVPEDAFYHVFEMNVDGSGLRQLTSGKYDDFDARYLPNGRIVFLSTRRGQAIQCGPDTARETQTHPALPDSYVRCGGGPERPVAVYTLHTMDADGGDLCAISPFEMFEWTPSVANDGTILYSRWDYIDRSNMPYMGLWSIHPDGTHARIVYKNFTLAPHCTFEPQSIPGSNKIVFTGSAHHAQTMGGLVLLDPAAGTEGEAAIRRLTPEIVFPEIEGWPDNYYASPWPLSERFYLVSWSHEESVSQGSLRTPNGMGLYLFDADGFRELLHRDPAIGCESPLPVRSRAVPPSLVDVPRWDAAKEGRFVLADVYRGLRDTQRGAIKSLRIVAVPPKTHPTMNYPVLGIMADDPGKCVLGTVPVEEDGSAYFRVPASVIVFFQALDERGMAIQSMRSATYVHPGQTLSCIGCHENRHQAPDAKRIAAMRREPSRIAPGPEGSWPLRFDRLVQPVLDQSCVKCHNPKGADAVAAKFDLTADKAYDTLVNYGEPSLLQSVKASYARGNSIEGDCGARISPVLRKLFEPSGHHGVALDSDSFNRIVTWLDTYGQRVGSFSEEQERQLVALREQHKDLLAVSP